MACPSSDGFDAAGALGSTASTQDVPGIYIAAAFPESFMADLLLETTSSSSVQEDDPLAAFRWSGTSKVYVESCLRGPLLTWLIAACKHNHVEIRDDQLRSGPLPRNPREAALVVDGICTAIRAHFETWSMPEPDFGDDD